MDCLEERQSTFFNMTFFKFFFNLTAFPVCFFYTCFKWKKNTNIYLYQIYNLITFFKIKKELIDWIIK